MSFIYKYKTSTTYPLYETCNVLYLLINDVHKYNPPYPQSAFTQNPGMTIIKDDIPLHYFVLTIGQSYKHFTIVNYDSRGILTRKYPILRP